MLILPVVHYEHDTPRSMLHMDTKKLGCIKRTSQRTNCNRRNTVHDTDWSLLMRP
jgi:hypothetical protein